MASLNSQKIKIWPILLLGFVYWLYLYAGVKNVPFFAWDESLYVNAARAYLANSKPYPVPDHPPFGKEIIAAGIYLFGDNPVGWRFFSMACGGLSISLITGFIYLWTRRLGIALFVGALTFLDPLFFVNFRLGLLDPPLTALLLLATLSAYLFHAAPKIRFWLLIPLGICLGLATATKMLTIVFFPVLGGAVLWKIYRTCRQPWLYMVLAILTVATLAALTFCATYLILDYSLAETWDLVRYIFAWHRVAGAKSHLLSRWWEWLYIGNPIFYFYKRLGPDEWQTIIATGNLILWVGAELAAIYAVIRFWRRPGIWLIALPVILQFALYTQKKSTFIHYMTEILPFLYILLGVTFGDLWDRYGKKYRRVLQFDFALFALGAFLLFHNYWPFIWGQPISAKQFQKASGYRIVDSTNSPSSAPVPASPLLETGP